MPISEREEARGRVVSVLVWWCQYCLHEAFNYSFVALYDRCLGLSVVVWPDEKVVDLEAQRRADEIQAAREEHATSQRPQEQPTLPNMGTREGAVGPS